MPPRNLNVILFSVAISLLCHVTYRHTRTAGMVGEAIELIDQYYVDPVDREALVQSAMQGIVSELDEHSSYFAVEEYESFQDSIHQEFAGIGIYVSQPVEGNPVRVVTPLVNSPALRAGVMPNDEIIEVEGEDVSTMPLKDVSDRLKGTPGTSVSIKLRRGERFVSLQVERSTIAIESVVGDHRDADHRWVFRLKSDPDIAYVRMKSFGEKTVRELEKVLADLDNDFSSLVLDLRGNGGGLLYAARDVCDLFLSSGAIVSTRIRGNVIEESYSATAGTLVATDKPMAVIIDSNSASASEIVAACLQDNQRATIVGIRSYGKGTVQEIIPLQYGKSALRLTVARYFRPNNENIHRVEGATEEDQWGVRPDEGFEIPMDRDALIQLSEQWRVASFPMLAGIESMDSDPPSEVEPANEEAAEEGADPEQALIIQSREGLPSEQEVELSAAAQANVDAGPESLAIDPPLRAAVGHLKRLTQSASDQAGSE